MTFQRELPENIRQDIEAQGRPYIELGFMTITHDKLVDPVRVVSDPIPFLYGGNLYEGIPYGFAIVTDTEEAPRAEIRMQNIDKRVGDAIRKARGRARIELVVLSSRDFDLTKNPREPVGTPGVMYSFSDFELEQVTGNAGQISGNIVLRDFTREAWPGIYATQSRLPGLFR